MILGQSFEGDDLALAKLQYEAYWEALRVLNEAVAKCFRNACHIAGSPVPQDAWPTIWEVDHRTLQRAHDRLAAIWRHSVNPPEPELAMKDKHFEQPKDIAAWFGWLREQVDNWALHDPEVIQLWVSVLQNQNSDPGYLAEDELCIALATRHPQIPWICPQSINSRKKSQD